jgi:uncharacterized protein
MSKPLSPDHYSAEQVIALLQLEPLDQEGAYFRRVLESDVKIPARALPAPLDGERRAYSAIYALITPDGFSAMHRLANDEIWAFLAGDTLEQLRLLPDGRGELVQLGADPAAGQRLLDTAPARCWQGTRLRPGGRWALFANVLAPEFVWGDFELGDRAELARRYPAFAREIAALTRAEAPKGKR